MFKSLNEDWKYVLSVLSIIFGALLIYPAGLFSAIAYVHILLYGGSQSYLYYFIFGLLILIIGLVMIIFPKKFNIRFIIGAILCFITTFIFSLINFLTIPQLKIMAGHSNNALEYNNINNNSAIQNIDYAFYENLLSFLILFFIIIGIIFIIAFIKYNRKIRELK